MVIPDTTKNTWNERGRIRQVALEVAPPKYLKYISSFLTAISFHGKLFVTHYTCFPSSGGRAPTTTTTATTTTTTNTTATTTTTTHNNDNSNNTDDKHTHDTHEQNVAQPSRNPLYYGQFS